MATKPAQGNCMRLLGECFFTPDPNKESESLRIARRKLRSLKEKSCSCTALYHTLPSVDPAAKMACPTFVFECLASLAMACACCQLQPGCPKKTLYTSFRICVTTSSVRCLMNRSAARWYPANHGWHSTATDQAGVQTARATADRPETVTNPRHAGVQFGCFGDLS